jgi:hypothetical protein
MLHVLLRRSVHIEHTGEPKTQFPVNICRMFKCSEHTEKNNSRVERTNPISSSSSKQFQRRCLVRFDWCGLTRISWLSMRRWNVHSITKLLRAFILVWYVFQLGGWFRCPSPTYTEGSSNKTNLEGPPNSPYTWYKKDIDFLVCPLFEIYSWQWSTPCVIFP